MKKVLLVSGICLFIDQAVKIFLSWNMDHETSIPIISDFLNITLVQNTGAAFSLLSNSTPLLIILTLLVLNAIYFMVIKDHELDKFETITYGILIGGILGNFIDRVFLGYVIDYIHFNFGNYNAPVFNIADICIVTSVLLIIASMFRRKNESKGKSVGK